MQEIRTKAKGIVKEKQIGIDFLRHFHITFLEGIFFLEGDGKKKTEPTFSPEHFFIGARSRLKSASP